MATHDEADGAAHVRTNQALWDGMAPEWADGGARGWAQQEPTWGIWNVPERELEMLPADLRGMRTLELGCGTAYVSAWLARRGADATGIDASRAQLATARELADRHDLPVTLMHGNAEATPFPDAHFDFAISEYGAAIWCDPYSWIPEAHRLLRPGGRLVFLGHHPLTVSCSPTDGASPLDTRLVRPYFDMHRVDWTDVPIDPGGIEFNLPTSDWVALFREVGFAVEDYREPRPADGGSEVHYFTTADWARAYPSEQVWKLRKRSTSSCGPSAARPERADQGEDADREPQHRARDQGRAHRRE